MKYKLVIFDLDGTILDTLEDLRDAVNAALEEYHLPTHSLASVRDIIGNGIKNLIDRVVPEGTDQMIVDGVFSTFKSFYGEHCKDKTKPYERIPEVLIELKKRGYLLAVISNKADFAVQELCSEFFPGLFDYVAGEKEGVRKKPAPDSCFSVMKAACAEAKETVYIGDSDVDVMTAKNAGVDCISVTWGFRSEEFIKEHGGTCFAHKPDELLQLI